MTMTTMTTMTMMAAMTTIWLLLILLNHNHHHHHHQEVEQLQALPTQHPGTSVKRQQQARFEDASWKLRKKPEPQPLAKHRAPITTIDQSLGSKML
jgi:hypothetical protein